MQRHPAISTRTKRSTARLAAIALMVGAVGLPISGQAAELQKVQAPSTLNQGSMIHGAADEGGDSAMRTMYVAMGAMTGYMFAVMPVTTTAVVVAVASGTATMWAYDAVMGPAVMGPAAPSAKAPAAQ